MFYLLLTVVAALVVTHVAFGAETLAAALGAGERPFIPVDSDVYLQVLLLAEGLWTVGKRTLEWLGPSMKMHVRVQSHFP